MKKLEVKKYAMDGGSPITTKELITNCLKFPVQGGLSWEDISIRVKLEGILKNAEDEISLEDTDAVALKTIVKSTKWGLYHEDLVDFGNEVGKL